MAKSTATAQDLRKRPRLAQHRIKLLEQLLETRDILADADLMNKIRQSEEDIRSGRYVTVREAHKRLRL